MSVDPGAILLLDVEKAAAGGRMLARHERQVVLVWGAIPGERVAARVERVGKGVLYAETIDVLTPSADRRPMPGDWRCGGHVLAHVAYPRQLALKAQIIQDAFLRLARVPLPVEPDVLGSPEHGYRMRARLHAANGRLGYFREGTHSLCDAALSGQLLPATLAWIAATEQTLHSNRSTGLDAVEIAENMAGDERACHLELAAGADASAFAALADDLVGLSAQQTDARAVTTISGAPVVTDVLQVVGGEASTSLRLRRDARAFSQANRFLIERLVREVVTHVPAGPVFDLYAGVGLFGLSLAALGFDAVTLVEGDPVSGADLERNAESLPGAQVRRHSVEGFLRGTSVPLAATFIVDPPRTGLSRDAVNGLIRKSPARIVYVSCDVATLARDTRLLIDAGYELALLTGLDMFPNTAHVESVAMFRR